MQFTQSLELVACSRFPSNSSLTPTPKSSRRSPLETDTYKHLSCDNTKICNPPRGVIMPFSYHSLHRLDTRFLFSWKSRHESHFFGHISGTGSRRHIYFKLDLWTHCSFQTSPRLSKSIEPSPRKKM